MRYFLIIPPKLMSELYRIREKTGKGIRMQILEAIKNSIIKFRELEESSIDDFIDANKIKMKRR